MHESIYKTKDDIKRETQASCHHRWEVGIHNLIIVGISRCMICGKISKSCFFKRKTQEKNPREENKINHKT